MSDLYYVAYADPAAGKVIGVYTDKDKAEAAAFRFSKTTSHYEGQELRVLQFRINTDGEIVDEA